MLKCAGFIRCLQNRWLERERDAKGGEAAISVTKQNFQYISAYGAQTERKDLSRCGFTRAGLEDRCECPPDAWYAFSNTKILPTYNPTPDQKPTPDLIKSILSCDWAPCAQQGHVLGRRASRSSSILNEGQQANLGASTSSLQSHIVLLHARRPSNQLRCLEAQSGSH